MTDIEWTDKTWNPVTGCSKVSAGCKNCYAETVANRFWGDRKFTDVICHPERLDAPLRWRKPQRVFVNSMSDLFHDDVPDEFIDRVFAVMAIAWQNTFQILTKRPERMLSYLAKRSRSAQPWKDAARTVGYSLEFHGISLVRFPLPNVWLGVSVEDQATAEERIPTLLDTPAALRFLSCEPLLGPLRLDSLRDDEVGDRWTAFRPAGVREPCDTLGIDWVIVGGESGFHARPCDVAWIRSIVDQCKEARVPCFVKQLGAVPVASFDPPAYVKGDRQSRIALIESALLSGVDHPKGSDPSEWPEDLRVREFPR